MQSVVIHNDTIKDIIKDDIPIRDHTQKITSVAVAVTGSVDSGKSSFVGVLTSGILDDGNGSARKGVAKHPHEIASGKTSDISTRLYDLPTNEAITFVDLCGHEDYFKTTTFGISGYFPDYAFLIVSANRGVLPMTKQHFRLLLSLSVPIIIVVTHIDIAPAEIYEQSLKGITAICKQLAGRSTTANVEFVNHMTDQEKSGDELAILQDSATNLILKSVMEISDNKQTIFPVISVSNKTGFCINVIKNVLEKLKPRHFWLPGGEDAVLNNKFVKLFRIALEKQQAGMSSLIPTYKEFDGGVFYVDASFNPPGIGLVLSGIARGKTITAGDTLYAGPFGKVFHEVRIKSLHNNMKQIVPSLDDHHRGCLAIAPKKIEIKKEHIGKGTVLLSSPELIKNVCYRFKAVISLFTQSLTLKTGYSPIFQLYTIRQSVRMTIDPADNNGNDVICFDGKTTAVAVVTFKFKQHPEFIEPFNMFVLLSGNIQGIGLILSTTSIMDDPDAHPDPHKNKKMYRRKHANPNRKVVKKSQ